MPTSPINTITNPTTAATTGTTGPKSLSSNDFMNLMLKQLQNQDPLNPTDSNQLLQQISQISTLQSNQSLQSSLSALTLQQSIGAAGNLIGKLVQGIDPNNTTGPQVSGLVQGVQVINQQVYLALSSGSVLPIGNITAIAPAPAAAAGILGS